MSNAQTIQVPVETELGERDHEVAIDISRLKRDDLGPLKARDPFLYHSIPAVHKAVLTFKDIDLSEDARGPSSAVVTRKSRVTTECHVSLLLEDIFDAGELFPGDQKEPELEDLFPFLRMPPGGGDHNTNDKELAQ